MSPQDKSKKINPHTNLRSHQIRLFLPMSVIAKIGVGVKGKKAQQRRFLSFSSYPPSSLGFTPTPKQHQGNNTKRDASLVWGFTMVEVVVMLSIITAISGIVLTSFTGLNEGTALNRAARELALAIRRSQNMSLAVTQIEVGSPPTFQIPPAVGIRLSTATPTSYFTFADLSPVDFEYSGASEKISGTNTVFERNVKINRIIMESGSLLSTVHILFIPPEATLVLTDGNGVAISGDKIDIEIITPAGQQKKTVTVRVSGQISVK